MCFEIIFFGYKPDHRPNLTATMLPAYVALPPSTCVPTTANVKLIPYSLPVWQPLTKIDVGPLLWKNKRQPVSSLVGALLLNQS